VQGDVANIVLIADSTVTVAEPGLDILSCEWLAPTDALAIAPSGIIRPQKFGAIVRDLMSGRRFALEVVREVGMG
jgi:hypothetical protein